MKIPQTSFLIEIFIVLLLNCKRILVLIMSIMLVRIVHGSLRNGQRIAKELKGVNMEFLQMNVSTSYY